MTRGLNAFKLAKAARNYLVERQQDDVRARGRTRCSRWLGPTQICVATATVAALLLGAAVRDASAAPATNRVSGLECKLDLTATTGTLAKLQADLSATGITGVPEIAFVVVYSLNNDNDGQPVPGGVTGPVICVNDELVGIATTTQTADIPASGTGASSVTTLDAEDVFILRYRLNGGTNDGDIEKVICHSTNDNTDCFRISPLVP